MPIATRLLFQSTAALLVVGFLTLLGIVGMTIWLGERARIYFDDVIEARDTRGSAVELRNAVQGAESSQRGFLVTGNEIYLAPYGTAKANAERQLDRLKQLLAPYPETQVVIGRLTSIIAEKFDEMDRTVSLKRERRDAEALALLHSNRGKALMDEANVFFAGIIRNADNRLTMGVAEQRSNAARLRWVSIIGGFIIVLVIGGATLAVFRYTRELARTRDEVSRLNESLERRVADRTADLARANEEIQRFAYIVTHDLRAPLVNIMGFTTELEGSVDSLNALIEKTNAHADASDPVVRQARLAATEDLPEAIGFIRSSTRKMDSLINAILKLSREGRRTIMPERVDLGAMIEASAAAIHHQLADSGGAINLDLNVTAMRADKLSLEQIFGNLLDNAVKYRARERPLRIDVQTRMTPGGRVDIEISDNGRGIAEHDLDRIFEPFRRSGVQDQPGEGIGLAYVRTLVRNLGGDITVTSVLDRGTTFRVVLPEHTQPLGSSPA